MIKLVIGDFVKKIFLIILMVLGIFLFVENVNASELNLDLINILADGGPDAPNLDLDSGGTTCSELLGEGLVALVNLFITGVRIIAVIIAVVVAMANFLPAISGDNPDSALKAAFKKTTKLFVVLVIVVSFPDILKLIGSLFDFDLSCIKW